MSSYSQDAADQVVRMSLQGTEFAVRLAGTGAKELAELIYLVLKDQKKSRGKTRLENMLKSGKELKVFAVSDSDLRKFCEEARRYGVLYTVLKDRTADDGVTDVMVKKEDAGKINRIFERFSLARVDIAAVRAEIEKDRAERAPKDPYLSPEEKKAEFIDEICRLSGEGEERDPGNGMSGKSPRYVPCSDRRSDTERDAGDSADKDRTSVRKMLDTIRQERNKVTSGNTLQPENKVKTVTDRGERT
ncbi:MAG: PcfB family protein [Oscillospiraceae bacterium]|nr:PcfB family protein [Oscillospiraceae bacterium]